MILSLIIFCGISTNILIVGRTLQETVKYHSNTNHGCIPNCFTKVFSPSPLQKFVQTLKCNLQVSNIAKIVMMDPCQKENAEYDIKGCKMIVLSQSFSGDFTYEDKFDYVLFDFSSEFCIVTFTYPYSEKSLALRNFCQHLFENTLCTSGEIRFHEDMEQDFKGLCKKFWEKNKHIEFSMVNEIYPFQHPYDKTKKHIVVRRKTWAI